MNDSLTTKNLISPAFEEKNHLIVLATDDTYAPYCAVAIASVINNTSLQNNYDIVILNESLSDENKEKLSELALGKENISLRFFSMTQLIEEHKDLFYVSEHFSVAMYYRFFIPQIFAKYNKALYLDCDIVAEKDVADLFVTDLKEAYAAAVEDCVIMQKGEYLHKTLALSKDCNYFNSGVMLFSVENLKRVDLLKEACELLTKHKDARWPDQDILNILFQGKLVFLDPRWNLITDLQAYYGLHYVSYPTNNADFFAKLGQDATERPYIIHFAGKKKPWFPIQTYHAHRFWHYSQKTPFHKSLLTAILKTIKKDLNKAKEKAFIYTFLSFLPKYRAKYVYYTNNVHTTKDFFGRFFERIETEK